MLQKILIPAAISLLVAIQAWKKGRVPVLWCLFAFAAGMYRPFYAIFPLILILMLPPLKSDELPPPDDDPRGGKDRAEQAAGAVIYQERHECVKPAATRKAHDGTWPANK